jgi:hypothetical protein
MDTAFVEPARESVVEREERLTEVEARKIAAERLLAARNRASFKVTWPFSLSSEVLLR